MCTTFASRFAALTPRRRSVLLLWARGESYAAIAAELGITSRTVEEHLSHARVALHAEPGVPAGRLLCFQLGQLTGAQELE